jgi:hypothetical protein
MLGEQIDYATLRLEKDACEGGFVVLGDQQPQLHAYGSQFLHEHPFADGELWEFDFEEGDKRFDVVLLWDLAILIEVPPLAAQGLVDVLHGSLGQLADEISMCAASDRAALVKYLPEALTKLGHSGIAVRIQHLLFDPTAVQIGGWWMAPEGERGRSRAAAIGRRGMHKVGNKVAESLKW